MHCKRNPSKLPYSWWFRNPAPVNRYGSLSHYWKGLGYIQTVVVNEISEASTVALPSNTCQGLSGYPSWHPPHTSSFFEPWLEKAPGFPAVFSVLFRQVQAVIISTGVVFHTGNLVGFRCVETSDNILTQHFNTTMDKTTMNSMMSFMHLFGNMANEASISYPKEQINTGCLIKYSTNKLNYLNINPSILISSKQASFWKIRSQQVCHLVSQAGSSWYFCQVEYRNKFKDPASLTFLPWSDPYCCSWRGAPSAFPSQLVNCWEFSFPVTILDLFTNSLALDWALLWLCTIRTKK